MKSPKAVTHSVRMDRKLYQEIAEAASNRSVSFNSLVSMILTKYVEFDQFVPGLQYMLIHKTLKEQLINSFTRLSGNSLPQETDPNQVLSAGEIAGRASARDTILTMGLPVNRDSLLYFVDTVLSRYMNFADCQRSRQDGHEVFYLRHDLGSNWSLFLKGYVSSAFKDILKEEVKIETTKDGITFLV